MTRGHCEESGKGWLALGAAGGDALRTAAGDGGGTGT